MASTSTVGRLMATLGLNGADFSKGVAKAKGDLASLSGSVLRVGTSLKGALGLTVAGIGLQQVVSMARQTIGAIASVGDEAKRAGMALESFQEWKFVAEQNRIGIDAMVDGFKELNLRADEFVVTGGGSATEAFERLGYTAGELQRKLKDPSALMLEIIGRMKGLDKAAQIRISDELFGGAAGERFVELLDKGEDGIRNQLQGARDMGLVMDREMIEKAAELDAKFNEVGARIHALWQNGVVGAAQFFGFIENERERLKLKPSDYIGSEELSDQVIGEGAARSFRDGKAAAADYADELQDLQAIYGQLMAEAERLAPYLQRAAGDAARMGEAGASDELNRIAYEMKAAAEQMRAGEISAADFETRLKALQEEATTLLGELSKIDAAPFGGIIAALGGLGEAIRKRITEALQLRAALPGQIKSEGFAPDLKRFGNPYEGASPYAPKSSPKPKSAPAMIHEIGDKAIGSGGKGSKGKKAQLDDYARSVESIKEETAALEAEAIAFAYVATSGVAYADAVEYARTRAELLAAAQRAGKAITPELTAEIDAMALAYTNAGHAAEDAAERMRKVEEDSARGADAIGGIFTAALQGSDAAKAAVANLILEIAKAQMMKAASGLFGGSSVTGLLGGLIGKNAMGTNNWRGGLTEIHERGGEIMNLPRGTQIIPNDISKRMADNASKGGGGVVINIDARGAQHGAGAEIEAAVRSGMQQAVNAAVTKVGRNQSMGRPLGALT